MLHIKRILLPIDFPNPSLRLVHHAATLAHHFHSEIIMLHVETALSQSACVPDEDTELAGRDMLREITVEAKKNLDHSLRSELDGLTISQRVLVKGNAARTIVETAQEEQADLIMMSSYGNTFCQFLLGAETGKVLHGTECPVWTDAHVEKLPVQELEIHNVLCAVDFTTHNHKAASWAAQMAAKFGARIWLTHVTPSVELWGPGGSYVIPELKEEFVGYASQCMAKLQEDMGIKSDVFIGSGDVPMVLSQAAKQTKADLLVTGCRPYGLHIRTHGYAIICAVPIPVLSI
jgi:nucleotide-binding universal stress UspA family protein